MWYYLIKKSGYRRGHGGGYSGDRIGGGGAHNRRNHWFIHCFYQIITRTIVGVNNVSG